MNVPFSGRPALPGAGLRDWPSPSPPNKGRGKSEEVTVIGAIISQNRVDRTETLNSVVGAHLSKPEDLFAVGDGLGVEVTFLERYRPPG